MMHTLWIRQHNKIASKLKVNRIFKSFYFFLFQQLNPRWNNERVFEESRKIVIAQLQHITFNEFLPVLLGQDAMK